MAGIPVMLGIGRLYLPDRLFHGVQDAYDNTDLPNPSPLRNLGFPFNVSPSMQMVPPILQLHRLKKAALSTGEAQTATATQIEQLQQSQNRLQLVQMCPTFLENLFSYADHRQRRALCLINNEIHAQPHTVAFNTWRLSETGTIPLPTALDQAKGVAAIATWFLAYLNRKSLIPEVNSEPAVQGEVLHGIIEPMNALLKTRYPPTDDHHPRWSRSCSALHLTPGSNSNAGYPDFLLLRSATHGDYGAIAEVKTWWAYSDRAFLGIFNRAVIENSVLTGATHPATKLLKQLHFFNSKFGFCTNGQVIIFFVRPNPNTLVVSQVTEWRDRRVHQAMAGLSFAGVDLPYIGSATLIDSHLCPIGDRVIING